MKHVIAPVEFKLAGKTLSLRRDNAALYRLQNAGLSSEFSDLFEEGKQIAATCNLLWALDSSGKFASPAAISEAIEDADFVPAVTALVEAPRASLPADKDRPEDAQKKTG